MIARPLNIPSKLFKSLSTHTRSFSTMAAAKIKLYTNHGCPWAHRVHIALAELTLPFEEEIIDLSVPRTPEYLKINPRGLVPTIDFNGEILTESAVVSNFLADAYPSHLVPVSDAPGGAFLRAKIAFFVDTFISKTNGPIFKAMWGKAEEVLTGSFVVRVFTLPKYGILPDHLLTDLSAKSPNFYRWGEAVSKHPSVLGIYDEKATAARTKERAAKIRAA
ncbi:glutathione S-transferase domain-containing protein [Hypoxylon sp. FL1150]|nr:glutathione S-transferase domain-containing protein [Hypoxylon sp. FL1150]